MQSFARRIPVPDDSTVAWSVLSEPGDYCGPAMQADGRPYVYFMLPIARDEDSPPGARSIWSVASPPHVFRECPDGSLEIRESIAVYGADKTIVWHGYLDAGNLWRQV